MIDLGHKIALRRLLRDRHITQAEFDLVLWDGDTLTDDSRSIVDFCDNGDAVIHSRGAYPIVLKSYVI